MDIAHAARIARRIYREAKKAYKRDRDHLVRLNKPFFVGTFHERFRGLEVVPDWGCDLFEIAGRRLTLNVSPPEYCDGASFAPDKVGNLDLACAYIAHDYLYSRIDMMAADDPWRMRGWTTKTLRALADAMLGDIIKAESPLLAMPFYWAVRCFGGLFHRLSAATTIAICLLLLGGCGGCMIPDAFDPSGEKPDYEVIPRNATEEAQNV